MSTRSNTEGLVYSGSLTDPAFFPERLAHLLFVGGRPIAVDMVKQLVTDGAFRAQVADHLDRRQRRAQAISGVERLLSATEDDGDYLIKVDQKETVESIVDLLCPDLVIKVREV